ncbi:MAG: peptide chain release factor N(5)-glutamine methyltransferase [Clostridia bacterium]|nr:peptide chain release factor N(5)-glutamine methyltransferase [Clostridia bacterium]
MSKKTKTKRIMTSIGGQAVMEGVMMSGKTAYATAVRDPDGEIQVESVRVESSPSTARARKVPFVRGIVGLFTSFGRGIKTLMRSSDVYAEDDSEPGRFEKWCADKLHCNLMDIITYVSVVMGVILAVGIFYIVPQILFTYIVKINCHEAWHYVLLGVVKLVIFLLYLALMLLMPSMKRMYRYHGAEHKTINCYESGKELNVENVMASSRIHDRCGTSFLFIVVIVNIVVFSLINWGIGIQNIENAVLQVLARLGVEIVLFPILMGVGYELLKLFAHFHGKFAAALKSPGALMQKVFTTREPDEEMCEVAIAAFNRAMEMDAHPEIEETKFVTAGLLPQKLSETKNLFKKHGIDESDAEWIYSLVLGVKRSEFSVNVKVKPQDAKRIDAIEKRRIAGEPLWYIMGDTEFYGCKIKVDERVLIPRPETELLAESVVQLAEKGNKILDLCTGSGCIAVSVAKACRDKNVVVTAADISEDALDVAKENAELNNVNVNFVKSDMFSDLHGRYNIIVCNPPYIKTAEIEDLPTEIKDHEPVIALDGGEDGLEFYRKLSKDVYRFIARGGMLLLEYGEGQLESILHLFPKRQYFIPVKDLSGLDRFVKIAF